MEGVPADLDLSPFIGAQLLEVGLGEFIVQFRFQVADAAGLEGGLEIGVEGAWELRDSRGIVVDREMPNAQREVYRLHRILGSLVTGTTVVAPTHIALRFATGDELRIFKNSDWECFSIQPGDIFI